MTKHEAAAYFADAIRAYKPNVNHYPDIAAVAWGAPRARDGLSFVADTPADEVDSLVQEIIAAQ